MKTILHISSKAIIIFALLLLNQLHLQADGSFQKIYTSNKILDIAQTIPCTGSGYLLCGTAIDSLNPSNTDIVLIKTDNLGTVLWANTYGTSNRDDAKSICLTSDGGMVIAGSTDNNANSRLDDLLILKTDSAGLLVWSKGIGSFGNERSISVVETADSGFAIGGNYDNASPGSSDFFLVKLNRNGNKEWSTAIGNQREEILVSMRSSSDGGLVLLGHIDQPDELYLVKTNNQGIPVWSKNYIGLTPNLALDFQQTPDLGYIILCTTSSASEPTVIKTNNLGTPEWVKIYNTSMGRFYGTHVEIGNDRNYILAGLVSPPIAGLEIGLLKIDSLGNTLWGTSYGSPSNNVANSVQQVQDSTFIISSNLQGLGSGGNYFMKTELDGFSTCNYTPLILSDSSITMAVDSYVVWMTPGDVEWVPALPVQTIQVTENILCINTGIKQTENAAPDFEIYPNPFSNEFSVRFANNDGIKRNLRILNVLGQELYQSSTTESSILISSVNWAQGMYQCIISEENSTVRSKMIVLSCQNCD